jgi:hypothetical protein
VTHETSVTVIKNSGWSVGNGEADRGFGDERIASGNILIEVVSSASTACEAFHFAWGVVRMATGKMMKPTAAAETAADLERSDAARWSEMSIRPTQGCHFNDRTAQPETQPS